MGGVPAQDLRLVGDTQQSPVESMHGKARNRDGAPMKSLLPNDNSEACLLQVVESWSTQPDLGTDFQREKSHGSHTKGYVMHPIATTSVITIVNGKKYVCPGPTGVYSLTVLETRLVKSRSGQCHNPSRGSRGGSFLVSSSFWGLQASLAHGSSTPVSASVTIITWPSPAGGRGFSFYKNASHEI